MVRFFGWVLVSLALMLAGCGGGSSADTTGPGIVSYSPAAGATLVDPDSPVTLVFNEAINHATVNSSSFALRRASDSALVAGTYEFTDNAYLYSGTAVRFVPAARLDDNALYQVAVSTAITDLAGNRLVAPLSWSFTTMPAGQGSWTPTTSTNAPLASVFHSAVWTGTEMLVWGGIGMGSQGYRYNPAGGGSWTPMATVGAPSPRTGHTAVWTGTEMVIWGGVANGTSYGWLNDGARYDPATNTWTPMLGIGAPAARGGHSAVWTDTVAGGRMVVWGGRNGDFAPIYPQGVALYNPEFDSWEIRAARPNEPVGRTGQTAVWTGTEMVVWGGVRTVIPNDVFLADGGRYDPVTNNWIELSPMADQVPQARAGHSAVWTGSEMIVWGGYAGQTPLALGARYVLNPVPGSWTTLPEVGAPSARWGHRAVWANGQMLVWGGYPYTRLGGGYDPAGNAWSYTTTLAAPLARTDHTAVWTGTEMIVWGGSNGTPLATGGRYTP